MNLSLSFCSVGLLVFALPLLINVIYAIFPPKGEKTASQKAARWAEIVENISRIAYLAALTFLVSNEPLKIRSVWLLCAALFLALYYIVWMRYFFGGRDIALLKKSFLFVPIPLAVFPVLYYIFAAIWMGNPPAAALMLIFGAAHITVTLQSFR